MSLIKTMITAITNKTLMNPPIVVEVTIPNNHKIISIVAMVQSILSLLSFDLSKFNK